MGSPRYPTPKTIITNQPNAEARLNNPPDMARFSTLPMSYLTLSPSIFDGFEEEEEEESNLSTAANNGTPEPPTNPGAEVGGPSRRDFFCPRPEYSPGFSSAWWQEPDPLAMGTIAAAGSYVAAPASPVSPASGQDEATTRGIPQRWRRRLVKRPSLPALKTQPARLVSDLNESNPYSDLIESRQNDMTIRFLRNGDNYPFWGGLAAYADDYDFG